MRIIKNAGEVIKAIAGEILNIETSTYHFLDGNDISKDVPKGDYRGYPRLQHGSIVDIFKGSAGYIFIPIGMDVFQFQEALIDAILTMENNMKTQDDKDPEILKRYHTVRCSYNTNVKVKSALSVTANSVPPAQPRRGRKDAQTNNLKRVFVTDPDTDTRRGRFTWFIETIDKIEQEIHSDNIEDSISRQALSILYDRDDICKLPHNHVTFEFTMNNLKGSENIVNESMTLFRHGNPLLFEISEYWREHAPKSTNANSFLRNIGENKLYQCDYKYLKFKPVNLSETGGETSTEVCSKCHSVLVGENYALAGNMKNPDNQLCVAICPLCLHSSPEDKPIEMKYFRIFRVKFPRSIEDVIEDLSISEVRREIRREALKKIERKQLYEGEKLINYTIIGDKYIAFDNTNDFLYTKLSVNPQFNGRKVCAITLIE